MQLVIWFLRDLKAFLAPPGVARFVAEIERRWKWRNCFARVYEYNTWPKKHVGISLPSDLWNARWMDVLLLQLNSSRFYHLCLSVYFIDFRATCHKILSFSKIWQQSKLGEEQKKVILKSLDYNYMEKLFSISFVWNVIIIFQSKF